MFDEQSNLAIVRTELDDVFFQTLAYDATTPGVARASTGEIFKQIANWDRQAYIYEINKDVGLFEIIGETAQVPLDTPKVRNKVIATMKDFAKGIEISKDLFDDVMHGVWAQDVAKFALKARVTQDQYSFSKYNGAFTTTLTADGVSFINAAHPLIGGGTTSNLITGGLSNTTFNNAMVALRQQVDQSNVPLGDVGSYLLVPPSLFQLAIQITESALVADSANNALNVWRSAYDITVYSSPYLSTATPGGSDTAWFLLTKNHSVTRVVRQGIETALRPWQYSNNRTYLYQANFREETTIPDYAGAVGSQG